MCGLLAEYNLSSRGGTSQDGFKDLLSLSYKRGPDDTNILYRTPYLKLGFNRLAIQDLSGAGRQPMVSPQNKFTIVFNGEIYNHLDLRKKLNFTRYKGHSDTETISVCLDGWGIEKTVKALNGMFAMVIFNHTNQEVSLVRDFAGIKPLFYGWDNKTLVAASQYDQIINHPAYSNKSIDPEVLKLYLQQHFLPAPFGLYHQTFQVLPGEIVTFSINGEKRHRRYWELPVDNCSFITNVNEAKEALSQVLDGAVNNQLISDVPLGGFLSGGVDSALIATALKKHECRTKVFTIGSDSKIHDESKRAQRFAENLGLNQTIWRLSSKEMLDFWGEAMNSLREPMADFSILPTFAVSKLAKKHATVVLSGDGGDELFFGYERFWSVGKNIEFQHFPLFLRKVLYGIDKYADKNKNLNAVLLASSQARAQQGLHCRFKDEWLYTLAPELRTVSLPTDYNVYAYENSKDIRTLLQHMRHAEFYGMMQKTLRKVDLASMENSLEVRVPFLDKKMIEISLQIDPLLNYGEHKSKLVLKNLLFERVPSVPKESVKKGFSIPLGDWIRTDLNSVFKEHLLNSDLDKFGFERSAVEQMLKMHNSSKEDLKWPLFTLSALTQ